MISVNDNFLKLPGSYLFTEIAHRVAAYKEGNPQAQVIKMGIGDVTLPLPAACIMEMQKAICEMAHKESFHGYGPEQGYEFLRQAIADDYKQNGVSLAVDEIFVSDGSKSDCGNIGDIFSNSCKVALTDPVYPVYVDTNAMAGRAGDLLPNGQWSNLVYMPVTAANDFVPELPKEPVDLIYLCFPNNPTGTTLTKSQLKVFVDYAHKTGALILFDAAYEAFISEKDVPHSIFEIPEARDCAIEFRSFSKNAGFTGTRCGFTVIPHDVKAKGAKGEVVELNKLWLRRQCTKFNGTPYIIQRGAAAVYTPEGKAQVRQLVDYYLGNAKVIRESLLNAGFAVYGGVNGPYIWAKTPGNQTSWDFFDYLLKEKNIVTTPGVGFGPSGEGYIRFSSLGSRENTIEAMKRF
ncbi:MAG: LL-diaminopimelate aminotransferase [Paludibacteraceae bacterium]|nr:LL-diaminopimelate aminotransferase [Paludibacteraceae bacterium]